MNNDERMRILNELAANVTQQVMDGLLLSVRCCPNCEFWETKTELCNNRVNCPQAAARPPADIIAFGCNQYKPGVPF